MSDTIGLSRTQRELLMALQSGVMETVREST